MRKNRRSTENGKARLRYDWVIAFLCIFILLCSACQVADGEASAAESATSTSSEPITPLHTEPSSEATAALMDEVLSYQEMKVEDGRVLRLEAMGTRLDSYFYGVKEIRVYEQAKLLQVISVRTAMAAEGEVGEYTQCWSPDDVMSLEDMNFDGITDIGLFGMVCNNEIPYYYWLWDTEEGEFCYSYSLQGASVNWETRQIVCRYKLGGGVYYTDYYEYGSKNSLQLVKRDVHTQNMH